MKSLILALSILVAPSVHAEVDSAKCKVVEQRNCSDYSKETRVTLCNPRCDTNLINSDSNADAVCKAAGFDNGYMDGTLVGSMSGYRGAPKEKYTETVLITRKGESEKIEKLKKREVISFIDCRR